MADSLHAHRQYSVQRLEELRARAHALECVVAGNEVCIYVTGSYGRLEAWAESDVDLFILGSSGVEGKRLPRLREIKLMAGLIEIAESMGFPEFSNDGRWLDIHYVDEMAQKLGSPRDDSENAFTARMLLLLESRPVLDEALYEDLLHKILDLYFADFDDHPENFVPGFLTNDILRFWRTLTLNYEFARLEAAAVSDGARQLAKATAALRNYKLKFSRLATCFSMVVNLVALPAPVTRERVIQLVAMTPQQRFEALRGSSDRADELLDVLQARYREFLGNVQRPKDELLTELGPSDARADFLRHAGAYGTAIYDLVAEVAQPGRLRYLVV